MDLSLAKRIAPHIHVVAGVNLEGNAARSLMTDVAPLLEAGRSVVLDLSTVEFADSSGLGVLCALADYARAHGSNLALACCSRRLEAILSRLPARRIPARQATCDGLDAGQLPWPERPDGPPTLSFQDQKPRT